MLVVGSSGQQMLQRQWTIRQRDVVGPVSLRPPTNPGAVCQVHTYGDSGQLHTHRRALWEGGGETQQLKLFQQTVAIVALLEATRGGHTLIGDDVRKILHTVLPLSDGSQSFTGG